MPPRAVSLLVYWDMAPSLQPLYVGLFVECLRKKSPPQSGNPASPLLSSFCCFSFSFALLDSVGAWLFLPSLFGNRVLFGNTYSSKTDWVLVLNVWGVRHPLLQSRDSKVPGSEILSLVPYPRTLTVRCISLTELLKCETSSLIWWGFSASETLLWMGSVPSGGSHFSPVTLRI